MGNESNGNCNCFEFNCILESPSWYSVGSAQYVGATGITAPHNYILHDPGSLGALKSVETTNLANPLNIVLQDSLGNCLIPGSCQYKDPTGYTRSVRGFRRNFPLRGDRSHNTPLTGDWKEKQVDSSRNPTRPTHSSDSWLGLVSCKLGKAGLCCLVIRSVSRVSFGSSWF